MMRKNRYLQWTTCPVNFTILEALSSSAETAAVTSHTGQHYSFNLGVRKLRFFRSE